jgi:hypothetical protein
MRHTKCCWRKLSVLTTLRLTWAACLVKFSNRLSAVLPVCMPCRCVCAAPSAAGPSCRCRLRCALLGPHVGWRKFKDHLLCCLFACLQVCMRHTKCCWRKLSVLTTLRLTWAACLVKFSNRLSAVLPVCMPCRCVCAAPSAAGPSCRCRLRCALLGPHVGWRKFKDHLLCCLFACLQVCMRHTKCCWHKLSVQTTLHLTWAACRMATPRSCS